MIDKELLVFFLAYLADQKELSNNKMSTSRAYDIIDEFIKHRKMVEEMHTVIPPPPTWIMDNKECNCEDTRKYRSILVVNDSTPSEMVYRCIKCHCIQKVKPKDVYE